MNTVYEVDVPKPREAVFPESCVVCGQARAEKFKSMMMGDELGRVDFYLYGIVKKPSQGPLVKVPVHDTCAKSVRNQFLKRFFPIVLIFICIVATGLIFHITSVISISAAIIISGIFFYILIIKPVPVEVENTNTRCLYKFKDKAYADIFAGINGSDIKVRKYSFIGLPIINRK